MIIARGLVNIIILYRANKKKEFLLVVRTLKIVSLNLFPVCHTATSAVVSTL